MRVRSVLVPFLALLPILLVHSPASAQGYVNNTGTLVLGSSEVRPGGTVTVSGAGCVPNATVTITFGPAPETSLGTTTANGTGSFSTTVTIPAGASEGSHTITATCVSPSGAQRVISSTVSVLGVVLTNEAGALPRGVLPRTGSSATLPSAAAGAALVAVGGIAVVASRRKRVA